MQGGDWLSHYFLVLFFSHHLLDVICGIIENLWVFL